MKALNLISTLLVLVFVGIGCTSLKPQQQTLEGSMQEENVKKQFEAGMHYLEEERYALARKSFEKILVDHPTTELELVVLYNLGAALEGLKECEAAGERYKQVTRVALGKFHRLEASALLRLSYAYECQSADDKVIVSLLDARRRAKYLPEDTVKAELPARLAGAYARTGNRNEAQRYFLEALKGIKFLQVKYKDSHQISDTLAQTLYFMGRAHADESEWLKNPLPNFKGLAFTQLYLLQAAELGSPKWSGRAVSEILDSYDRVWKVVGGISGEVNSPDAEIRDRDKRRKQVELMKEALHGVRTLKAQRLPTRQETGDARRLFTGLEDQEKKMLAYLSESATDTVLTPEGNRREGLRREGKIQGGAKTKLEADTATRLPPKGRSK